MKTLAKTLVLLFILGAFSCKKKKEEPVAAISETNDKVPAKSSILKRGTLNSYQHSLAGEAQILKDSTGNILLRLEQYTMTSGPDVDVLLSKKSSYSSDAIKVADLNSSYSKNGLNFDIDDKIDLTVYKHVVIWCAEAKVSFGDAEPK